MSLSSDEMLTLGDIVLISGLASKEGRKLNDCYGKVVAKVNKDNRVGVVPYSDGKMKSIPFDEANAVRLKLVNVSSVPKKATKPPMQLYKISLLQSFDKDEMYDRSHLLVGVTYLDTASDRTRPVVYDLR